MRSTTHFLFDFRRFFDILGFSKKIGPGRPPYRSGVTPIPGRGDPHTRPGRPSYQSGATPIPVRGVGDRWRPGLRVVFRGVVLSVGALSNMSGFCIVCWGFVLSVGALYSNLMYPHPI